MGSRDRNSRTAKRRRRMDERDSAMGLLSETNAGMGVKVKAGVGFQARPSVPSLRLPNTVRREGRSARQQQRRRCHHQQLQQQQQQEQQEKQQRMEQQQAAGEDEDLLGASEAARRPAAACAAVVASTLAASAAATGGGGGCGGGTSSAVIPVAAGERSSGVVIGNDSSMRSTSSSFLRAWVWKREAKPDRDRFVFPYKHPLSSLYTVPFPASACAHDEHTSKEAAMALHPSTTQPPVATNAYLTIHQQRFFTTGFASTVWDSAIVTAKYFERHPNLVRGKRCVELGAGCGLVGLTLATLGACYVRLTDLPENLPLLRRNIVENGLQLRAEAAGLDWEADADIRPCVRRGKQDGKEGEKDSTVVEEAGQEVEAGSQLCMEMTEGAKRLREDCTGKEELGHRRRQQQQRKQKREEKKEGRLVAVRGQSHERFPQQKSHHQREQKVELPQQPADKQHHRNQCQEQHQEQKKERQQERHRWHLHQQELEEDTQPFDVLVATDVFYCDEVMPALVATVGRLTTPASLIVVACGRNRQGFTSFLGASEGKFQLEKIESSELDDVFQCDDVDVFQMSRI